MGKWRFCKTEWLGSSTASKRFLHQKAKLFCLTQKIPFQLPVGCTNRLGSRDDYHVITGKQSALIGPIYFPQSPAHAVSRDGIPNF